MSSSTILYNPNFDNVNTGVLRANFSSPCSINMNGVVLGNLNVLANPTTPGAYYLECNTIGNTASPIINIPQGYSDLTLRLTDGTETNLLAEAVPDYDIIITFKVLEDENFNADASFQ